MQSLRRHGPSAVLIAALALPLAGRADLPPRSVSLPIVPPSTEVGLAPDDKAGFKADTRVDLNAATSINTALRTNSLRDMVETADFERRDIAVTFAQQGHERGAIITGVIKERTDALPESSRQEVQESLDEVEKARVRLVQSLSKGRESTDDRWDIIRERLGERYEQYAEALDEARQSAIRAGAVFAAPVNVGGNASG
ncbi:MAG: hypothetical protein ABII82_13170 [Verrucomicrobiota bacterium]